MWIEGVTVTLGGMVMVNGRKGSLVPLISTLIAMSAGAKCNLLAQLSTMQAKDKGQKNEQNKQPSVPKFNSQLTHCSNASSNTRGFSIITAPN